MEETKKDLYLKRVQLTIAIIAGVLTVAVGGYNVKKAYFPDAVMNGDLKASVLSEKGEGLPGISVQIYDSGNTLVGSGTTGGDGTYSKKGLAPGGYIFKASRMGFETQVVTIRVNSKDTTEFEVILHALSGPQNSQPPSAAQPAGSPIRSALEEAGASWIKKTLVPKKAEETQ